nr:MAG TPA: hypothetical protein [Caudoviricetes sp.]
MDRLTFDGKFCDIAMCELTPGGSFCEDGTCSQRRVWERLKQYEDTGLEPEEIGLLAKQRDLYVDACGEIPLKRIRNLAQADREGRCVVLPCRPSDVTVYQLRSKKHARGVGISCRHVGSTSVWGAGHYALHHQGFEDCLDREFGKTWFLSREEAEAALSRQQPVEEGDRYAAD